MPRCSTKRISKLKENPYAPFDSSIGPKYLGWILFDEPISNTQDERRYSNGALRLIERQGTLIEAYQSIEKDLKRQDDDDDDDMPYYPKAYGQDTSLYLFKDNILSVKRGSDETITLDSYYPASKTSALPIFAKYILKEIGESRVSILTTRNGALVATKISFAPPAIPDFDLNYGAGFKKTYATMVAKLNERKAGLVLLHGAPGTGKSVLLKHLTSIVDREFIFVPVGLIPKLADPDMITLLMSKKESVLILEDAEQAIQQRGNGGDDATVSTILNTTDGILGNVLNITIIASYNIDSSHVDKALMRKGRLLYEHSFQPLKIDEAKKLAKKLGKKIDVIAPMTLADIYGSDTTNNHAPAPTASREMGFHTLLPTPELKTAEKKAEKT